MSVLQQLPVFTLCWLILFNTSSEARKTGLVRTEKIDMVVLHSTGGPTCDAKTNKPIWVSAGTLEDNMRNIEAHPVHSLHD
jgi:N-acetylmuramoyl-L-alanine amidase